MCLPRSRQSESPSSLTPLSFWICETASGVRSLHDFQEVFASPNACATEAAVADWRVRNDCSTGKFGPGRRRRLPASEFRPWLGQPVGPTRRSDRWPGRPRPRSWCLNRARPRWSSIPGGVPNRVVRRLVQANRVRRPHLFVSVESIASTCSRLWRTASVFALSSSKGHSAKAASIVSNLGGSSLGPAGISPVATPRSRSEKRPKPRNATIGAARSERMVVA